MSNRINELRNSYKKLSNKELRERLHQKTVNFLSDDNIKFKIDANIEKVFRHAEEYNNLVAKKERLMLDYTKLVMARDQMKKTFLDDPKHKLSKKHLDEANKHVLKESKEIRKLEKEILRHEYARESLINAAIILDVTKNLTPNSGVETKHADELLRGAHEIVQDGGKLFNELKESGLLNMRISSHYSKEKRYFEDDYGKKGRYGKHDGSLNAPGIFNEVLIGHSKIDGKEHTWIQHEAYALKDTLKPKSKSKFKRFVQKLGMDYQKVAHIGDFLKYTFTGKNIGQYGNSIHKDTNPIMVVKSDQGEQAVDYHQKFIDKPNKKGSKIFR